jgi:hypothetical protein
MSPSAIAQRLDHRFRLLRGGRKGARHETLHDTLRWSYELLSAAEAALFDRLSVFAGGFTLESVEAVCADLDMVDVPAVLDLLTSLVDRSMVVAEPTADGDRFRLLETLREYGTDRLAATSALDTYRAKHASWFRDVALEIEQQLWTPNEATAWRTIEAEWDNLRTAFSTALGQDDIGTAAEIVGALGWCAAWTARDELFGGAEVLLGKPGIEQHPRYADLCGIAAWTSFNRVELRRAIEFSERGLTPGRPDHAGLCHLSRMAANVNLGDDAGTFASYEAWVQDASESPDGVRAHAENMMGLYLARMRGSREGLDYTTRGMAIAQRSGSASAIAYAHMCRGWALSLDQPDAAMASFETAVKIAARLAIRHNMGSFSQRGLADLAARHETVGEALVVCRRALRSALDLHHVVVAGQILAPAALVLRRAGDNASAAMLLGALAAHGQRPSGDVEPPAPSDPTREDYDRGGSLTIQQAAQLALDAIDKLVRG